MTSLLFVRKPHVYLPEVPAYRDYLAQHYPEVTVIESTTLAEPCNPNDYDIMWHFMGLDTGGQGRYVVHEYNSLSTRPLAKAKNRIKALVNARPHRRVFLSEAVRQGFGFRDTVPWALRDMGIDARFFAVVRGGEPEYDFVYAGGLNRGPLIATVLDRFAGPLKDMRVLLIGDAPEALLNRYRDHENIVFHGRVPYEQVPLLLAKARYGLNIMPDIYPFNVQTATKVLEYCAAGLPVVSTDYAWIRSFEADTGARCFRLDRDAGNLTRENIAAFEFRVPSVNSLRWDNVIADSGIFSFLSRG